MSIENNSSKNVSPFSTRRMVTLLTMIGHIEEKSGLGKDHGEFGVNRKHFNT